eukprot:1159708-Pelagomonas_calceolata.AAC.4
MGASAATSIKNAMHLQPALLAFMALLAQEGKSMWYSWQPIPALPPAFVFLRQGCDGSQQSCQCIAIHTMQPTGCKTILDFSLKRGTPAFELNCTHCHLCKHTQCPSAHTTHASAQVIASQHPTMACSSPTSCDAPTAETFLFKGSKSSPVSWFTVLKVPFSLKSPRPSSSVTSVSFTHTSCTGAGANEFL